VQFLRAKDHKLVPWKNGGGVTREIAVYVDGTEYADFLWRVSIATVDRDGPFSRFEGIDRTIAVLQGAGMILKSDDDEARLTPESQPFAFRGETPIDASVIDGETTDLNAMTRRGYFNHFMERLLLTEQTIRWMRCSVSAEARGLISLPKAQPKCLSSGCLDPPN
jgi:environmental stress-induced protein Ves